MSCKIITVFNEKGGAGKTTTTMNLAGTLGMRGFKTLVVDCDDQGTATRWVAEAEDDNQFPAIVTNLSHMGDKMHREIGKYIDQYDFIIIDCPPGKKTKVPDNAMKVSDLAIIPLNLTPPDLWASNAAKAIALEAKEFNPELTIQYLANNVHTNRSVGKEILDILQSDTEVGIFKAKLGSRVAFQTSVINGTTVHSEEGNEKAVHEVNHLTDEVLSILGVKNGKKAG
ncbi:AAA family ATPase [Methylobacillus sp. Pita2]|uniref:AAA family ATPase n=1 Tax=Methylobacillus sp. Pita2 TaxID=3383245 RepID=UPI0038B69AEA